MEVSSRMGALVIQILTHSELSFITNIPQLYYLDLHIRHCMLEHLVYNYSHPLDYLKILLLVERLVSRSSEPSYSNPSDLCDLSVCEPKPEIEVKMTWVRMLE